MISLQIRTPDWVPENLRVVHYWLVITTLLAAPASVLFISVSATIKKQKQRLCEREKERDKSFEVPMTLEQAYAIKSRIAEQEFAAVYSAATSFALLKSYGVPSIASLNARAARRAAAAPPRPQPQPKAVNIPGSSGDILTDMIYGPRDSPAYTAAINKINQIHSRYRPTGKMSDPDLLFVLSLLLLEPVRWIERYEYRSLENEEVRALAMVWRDLGVRLEIPWDCLPSYKDAAGSDSGFGIKGGDELKGEGDDDGDGGSDDALRWMRELEEWSLAYEEEHMSSVKDEDAMYLADHKLSSWVKGVPGLMRRLVRRMITAEVFDERLRVTMG
ncbi:hypothetical protein F5Y16DRAFT_156584 [Xylariaceae sp. FL0255]|nr:hypothetical protein F5Y16DRAFT_156584 [Xylariaceae sp. FL0255]